MAKAKAPPGVQNKHIYTRASYLYQAAAYLATASLQQASPQPSPSGPVHDTRDGAQGEAVKAANGKSGNAREPSQPSAVATDDQRKAQRNMSRALLADMRAVARKATIRARPEVKRSICRYCDTLLVEGQSCDAAVENASRGGRKPWADVLVVRCRACAGVKRFPVGEPRTKQMRRDLRAAAAAPAPES